MIGFKEITHRALHGPMLSPRDFDLRVFVPEMRKVVRDFGIQYDPMNPVPADDDLADRVFRAGLKFYEAVGTYCVDSERVVRFEEAELLEALEDAPSTVVLGHGADRREMVARRPEIEVPPWCSLGAAGAGVSSERILTSLVTAYAQLPLTDSITLPSLTMLDGEPIIADTPLEIEGAIRATSLGRDSLRRAGRPGIPMVNGIATAVSGRATIAASQFGFRETDGWEIASIAELKTNFDLLSKVSYIRSIGGNILAETGPILGGLAGGPEGTAVLTVAYHLEGILVKQACLHHPFVIHVKYGCGTGRDALWVRSVSTQAISRNSHFPILDLGYTAAGPMTRMVLYETAAWVICAVVCGANIEAEGVASATHVDYLTPYEPRLAAEVAHAAAGMDRSHASEIVKALLERYESQIPDPPLGAKYQECFDIERGTPSLQYLELYTQVKEELVGLGLKF
jgi:methylamine--corrinoid protein Co-methyltransferase